MVYKLQNDVTSGTKIEKTMLREVEVGSFGLTSDVIKNVDDITGKYAKSFVLKDDILTVQKFSNYAIDEQLEKIQQEAKN